MLVREIISPVLRSLGYAIDDVEADAALLYDLLECVNTAQEALLRYGDWTWRTVRETLITEAGVGPLALPEDFLAMAPADRPMWIGASAGCLRAVTGEELSRLLAVGATGGLPTVYQLTWSPSLRQWHMILWPTPNAALTLSLPYLRQPATLTDLDQTPSIPEIHHRTLRLGALAEAEETFGREAVTRPKFEAALIRDWAAHGSPDRGQRSGHLRMFGESEALDDLDPVESIRLEVMPP